MAYEAKYTEPSCFVAICITYKKYLSTEGEL